MLKFICHLFDKSMSFWMSVCSICDGLQLIVFLYLQLGPRANSFAFGVMAV